MRSVDIKNRRSYLSLGPDGAKVAGGSRRTAIGEGELGDGRTSGAGGGVT